MTDVMDLPHGIRTNNPGNLRGLAQFVGSSRGRDGFLIFQSEVDGIRAAALTLHAYYYEHGLKTISTIVHRWAPPNENRSDAYADFIGEYLGWSRDEVLNRDVRIDQAWQAIKYLDAAFIYENGVPPHQWHSWPSWYCTKTYVEALTRADKWREV